jgi:cell division protein FtsZ
VFEPLRAASYSAPGAAASAQPEPLRTSAEPEIFQPAARAEPTVVEPRTPAVARIVDPSVADDDEAGPLFPESSNYGEERRQKGSWLSIFGGRPRHDAPAPTLRSAGSAQPAAQPQSAPTEDPDDLEIPSFLRRLAN